jgi:arsenate reductase
MSQITLYGIPNCDTVKKARSWLEDQQVSFTFHDFKKLGVSEEALRHWLKHVPLETLLNRKGTTWRKLTDADKGRAESVDGAIALMCEHTSLIKRPVFERDDIVHAGFSADAYNALVSRTR